MATADTNRATTGNTGSLLSRAFGQKGVAMTSSFEILGSQVFGPFSRYKVLKVRDRFGEIWFHVQDAELLDDVTGAPSIVRQSKSFTKALEGFEGQESVGLLD